MLFLCQWSLTISNMTRAECHHSSPFYFKLPLLHSDITWLYCQFHFVISFAVVWTNGHVCKTLLPRKNIKLLALKLNCPWQIWDIICYKMVFQFSDHHLSVKAIIFSEITRIVSALKQKQLHLHFCLSRISWTIRDSTEFIFLTCWEFFDVLLCRCSWLANINIHMHFGSTLPLLNGRNAVFPLEQPVESRVITCSYSEISTHPTQSFHAKNWNTAPHF